MAFSRYGVAPDHLKMKSLEKGMQRVLDDPRVRLFADVTIGTDVTVEELRACYDAVVYAVGAPADRQLGVPGETLPGSTSATEFVAWYSGHPDYLDARFDLQTKAVAVVGLGNVAVDVARILLKSVDELRTTDLPEQVIEALEGSAVTDVHVLGRRGPAHARWTHKELRELGDLTGVDVLVSADDVDLDESGRAIIAEDHRMGRMVETLVEWSGRASTEAPRRLHLHFWSRPVEIVGTDQVTGIRYEQAGELLDLEVGMVLRSVGYAGVPLQGIPFDETTATIPSDEVGRVLRDGAPSAGEYVSGWARRGPTGVIGTNKPDGELVARALLEDAETLRARGAHDRDALERLLTEREVPFIDLEGWDAINTAEITKGTGQGRPRAKLPSYGELRTAAHGTPS